MNITVLSRGPNLYSTRRLVEAIEQRGHQASVINYLKSYVVTEKDNPEIHYEGKRLGSIDAIIPRIGASATFYGTAIVRQFEMMHIFSANSSQSIVRSRDKLRTLQILSRSKVGMPKTCFARTPENKKDLIRHIGGAPLVIKLLEGTQGVGVLLAQTNKEAESILETFYGLKVNILIQEFIREANGSDIRVFVVDGKVVGAMKRQAPEGEFRSNLHRGGTAMAIKLTDQEEETAIMAAKALNLHIAGVDLLPSVRGPLVMEVNSSPGLEGIEKTTGNDIASEIVTFIERKVAQRIDINTDEK